MPLSAMGTIAHETECCATSGARSHPTLLVSVEPLHCYANCERKACAVHARQGSLHSSMPGAWFSSVSIRAFKSFGAEPAHFTLPPCPGVIGIVGPNGAGARTLHRPLCHAVVPRAREKRQSASAGLKRCCAPLHPFSTRRQVQRAGCAVLGRGLPALRAARQDAARAGVPGPGA